MSHFATIDLQVTNVETLIQALCACGLTRDQIEVHEKAQPLHDYHGKQTKYRWQDMKDERFKDYDCAHVIVRRQHLGTSNNDLGYFIDQEKGSIAFLCDFSRSSTPWNDSWQADVLQQYAAKETVKEYADQGQNCITQEHNGKVYVYARA